MKNVQRKMEGWHPPSSMYVNRGQPDQDGRATISTPTPFVEDPYWILCYIFTNHLQIIVLKYYIIKNSISAWLTPQDTTNTITNNKFFPAFTRIYFIGNRGQICKLLHIEKYLGFYLSSQLIKFYKYGSNILSESQLLKLCIQNEASIKNYCLPSEPCEHNVDQVKSIDKHMHSICSRSLFLISDQVNERIIFITGKLPNDPR